jgi:hypothetical protein
MPAFRIWSRHVVIVISGALLVIAVVFLGIGLKFALAWVYASIAVSALAFGFMMIALRQQRNSLDAEPTPPLHPLGTTGRAATTTGDSTGDVGDGEVTVLPPGAVTQPDVPLVPATPKSAARKVASKSAAKTTAAGTATAAKKAAPAKRSAAKTAAATESATDAESETPVKKRAPRKTAAKKAPPVTPPVPEDDQPAEPNEN